MESVSGSWGGSAFGKSGWSRGSSSKLSKSSLSDAEEESDRISVASSESLEDKDNDILTETTRQLNLTKQKLGSDIDPNRILHLRLTETDTITLLDLTSLSVSNEATEEVAAIKTANARYKEVD